MLELLTICVGLLAYSSDMAVSKEPLLGKWVSDNGDFFEFRGTGEGADFIHILESGMPYTWRIAENGRIIFSYEQPKHNRSCEFTINENTLTISKCSLLTSKKGHVRTWSGRKK